MMEHSGDPRSRSADDVLGAAGPPSSPRVAESGAADVESTSTSPTVQADAAAILAAEPRNLIALGMFHALLRLAWIFKTESVLIPAFLDVIAGAGWIRGWLPVLNRFGQSVPPIFCSAGIDHAPIRSRWLLVTTAAMAGIFAIFALVWSNPVVRHWPYLPFAFLICYALFFSATGVNQLAFGAVQGKLIRPDRRGRILKFAGLFGSLLAASAAYFLLGPWMSLPNGAGYTYCFATTAGGFALAWLCLLAVREPAATVRELATVQRPFRDAWQVLATDHRFRQLAVTATLSMLTMVLFPHFQWLGRERLHATGTDLMYWVMSQNIAVGLISWGAGIVGDRYGYRLVLQSLVFVMSMTPFLAIYLSSLPPDVGRPWFWTVFLLLGSCPVAMRAFSNYALELADESAHARYISTLNGTVAVGFLFAPLIGWGFDSAPVAVFLGVGGLIFLGGCASLRLSEPRHHLEVSTPLDTPGGGT